MQRSAFTLLELLIVVAIIAILAAIAVPNLLDAQVRAKVSRVRADSRTILIAVEAYAMDNAKYPIPECRPYQERGGNRSAAQFVPGGFHLVTGGGFAGGLSSPIAYLTSANLKDPFAVGVFDDLHDRMFYKNIPYSFNPGALYSEPALPIRWILSENQVIQTFGAYRIGSLGPMHDFGGLYNTYDPTNGTVSEGDIYITQKHPEGEAQGPPPRNPFL